MSETNSWDPEPGEYASFAAGYIDLVRGRNIPVLLSQQHDLSHELFTRLSVEQANFSYAPGKWTIKQMLGHIIDTERVFAYRLMVFSRESVTLPGFDQDVYVHQQNQNSNIQDLAEEFSLLRKSHVYLIRALSLEQLERTGIASGSIFSVRALASMIAGHERHHLIQLQQNYSVPRQTLP